MSSMIWSGTLATTSLMSASESLKAAGSHLSNFLEYLRTAASPFLRMSSITPFTTLGTSALGPKSGVTGGLDFRYRGALAKCGVDVDKVRDRLVPGARWQSRGAYKGVAYTLRLPLRATAVHRDRDMKLRIFLKVCYLATFSGALSKHKSLVPAAMIMCLPLKNDHICHGGLRKKVHRMA